MAVIQMRVIIFLSLFLANISLVRSHRFHEFENAAEKASPPITTALKEPDCGSTLNALSGFIQSPNYPNSYPPNSRCTWSIQAAVGKRVRLEFHEFLTGRHDCITIRGASSKAHHRRYRRSQIYCGRVPSFTLFSVNNTLNITFNSDERQESSRFYLNFTIVDAAPEIDCGSTLNGPSGFIQSPNFPDSYPPNSRCTWSIQAGVGKRVRLEFHEFLTESHYDCITISGATSTAYYRYYGRSRTTTYCGRVSPRTLLSVNNTLNITFNSDESVESTGFYLNFTIVDAEPDCGSMLNGPSGVIKSPNYPDSYPPNSRCTWSIQAGVGKRVRLEFHEFLTAHHDCIIIRGATSTDYRHYGRSSIYCGRVSSRTLLSVNNTLNITFNSDESVELSGFYLNFTIVDAEPDCGSMLNGPSGVIKSPNYPDSYPPNSRCTWSIQAGVGKRVRLEFHEFLTAHHDCIIIRGATSTDYRHYGRSSIYCGRVSSRTLLSVNNTLNITFNSDESLESSGFYLNFTIVDAEPDCGATLNGSSGFIQSPNFPNSYPPNSRCTWNIQTSVGKRVRLEFHEFLTESRYDCITVRGAAPTNNRVHWYYGTANRYCGRVSPRTLFSVSNTLGITFTSDHSVQLSGFYLNYTTVDSGS